jgi:hypothetical protein
MKPITWKTIRALVRHTFAPIDNEPEAPDHKPRWVMRDGAPALCCDQHPVFLSQHSPLNRRPS